MSKSGLIDVSALNFRSVSMMGDKQAEQLAELLRLSDQPIKRKTSEQNLIIKNGVLTKLDEAELNLITDSNKILDKFTFSRSPKDKFTLIRNYQNQQIQQDKNASKTQKMNTSFIEEFKDTHSLTQDGLIKDYCRIHYEKKALEQRISFLRQQNQIKDSIINDLRHRIQLNSFQIVEPKMGSQKIILVNHHNLPPYANFHPQESPKQVHRGVIQFNYEKPDLPKV